MAHTIPRPILLTRPAMQARRFAQTLSATFGHDVRIIASPVLDVRYLAPQIEIDPTRDVIFTSENGVSGFSGLATGSRGRAFCVGDRTAQAARDAGFDALSARGTTDDLINLIATEGGGAMIYARGVDIARDLTGDLGKLGISVQEVTVYGLRPAPLNAEAHSALTGDVGVIFPLFSPRSAAMLTKQFTPEMTAQRDAICLSPAVRDAALRGGFETVSACAEPNAQQMLMSIAAVLGCRAA